MDGILLYSGRLLHTDTVNTIDDFRNERSSSGHILTPIVYKDSSLATCTEKDAYM